MKPTFFIFKTEEIDYWDQYPEEYNEMVADALEAFNDLNDTEWTREQFMEYLRGFKVIETSTDYVDGDPTNTVIVHDTKNDIYYMGQHYWDSWGGNGSFDEPYTEHPVVVEKRPVTREEWVEV